MHLYPNELNLYGDSGNVACLVYRLKHRGYNCDVISVGVGDDIPDFDIMVIGGGQDKEMDIIAPDVRRKAGALSYYIEHGRVVLAICGGYQLLGEYYKTDDRCITLAGALPFYTVSNDWRMIGNYAYKTNYGNVVGFENHAGRTILINNAYSFGEIIAGYGNNGYDNTEGIEYKNCIGTYCHGPMLPKNIHIADMMISRVVGNIAPLDDKLEEMCHRYIYNKIIY